MEHFDAYFFWFSLGTCAGFVVRHFVAKHERRFDYERGRLDGINYLWPYFVVATVGCIYDSSKSKRSAGHASDGDARGG